MNEEWQFQNCSNKHEKKTFILALDHAVVNTQNLFSSQMFPSYAMYHERKTHVI